MRDKGFVARVRDWLRTDEQRKLFDFICEVPMAFALENAGERWTEDRISEYLNIPQDRIPTLKKSLRRAFQRQIRLLPIEH